MTLAAALRWKNIVGAINILPIPAPFAANTGLDPLASYFMPMMRNIVPAGRLNAFKSYLAGEGVRRLGSGQARGQQPLKGRGFWMNDALGVFMPPGCLLVCS